MVETSGVEIYLLSGGTEIAYIIAKYIYKMLLTCRQHAVCAHSVTNHMNKTYFHDATALSGPGPSHFRSFTITLRHTTLGRTPLRVIGSTQRPLPDTPLVQETDIHVAGSIRTHSSSKRAAAD